MMRPLFELAPSIATTCPHCPGRRLLKGCASCPSALIGGLRGDAIDFDVAAKFTPESDAGSLQQTDDRGAMRDFPHRRVIVKAEFTKAGAVRAVRADVPDAKSLTAFCSGEGQSGSAGWHGFVVLCFYCG